jgi:phage terminase small subunit
MALTPEQEALSNQLTNLQRRTVLGVVAGLSQRQAYYEAGGKAKNDDIADASASELLSNPKVRAFWDSLNAQAISNAVMSRTEALERLSLMGRTRITDIVEFETVAIPGDGEDGEEPKTQTIWRMKESAELQEVAAAAIKSVTFTKQGPKIEMYDAREAITQLGKMEGWEAAKKVELGGAVAVLDKEDYKQARAEMLKNDDC